MKIRKYIRHFGLIIRFRYHAYFLPDVNDKKTGRKIHIQDLQGELPNTKGSQMLVYAACDSLYFNNYGYAFIESLLQNASNICIHIHIYNPEKEQINFLKNLGETIQGNRISHTWETVDLENLNEEERGRYYYSMRFLRMAQIFKNAQMNCLCLDIDSLVVDKLDRLLHIIRDADIAFYARFNKRSMGTKLLAGTLYLRYSELTKSFLSAVGNQIEKFIVNGRLLEKLDQLIIYDNFKRLIYVNPKIKFLAFDQSIIDIKFTDDGLIWYPKGQSKNQQKYQEKANKYKAAMEMRVVSDNI